MIDGGAHGRVCVSLCGDIDSGLLILIPAGFVLGAAFWRLFNFLQDLY
jgi:hypothetical protein